MGDLTSQLHRTVWDTFHKNKNTLLIGDSSIKDIDPQKLVKMQVVLQPACKVADINMHMDECADTYSKVVICIGSNDCAGESMDHESVVTNFKQLLVKAKSKVMSAADVVSCPEQILLKIWSVLSFLMIVSSMPPRRLM